MDHHTPMILKRRAQARLLANNPHVKQMEQRAHENCVDEYAVEIFTTLVELEEQARMSPELIHSQPQITVPMRPVLFDFLLDVHTRLKLSVASFYLTISVVDRYCSLRIVRKDHFQLLGLTALWLAAKFTEPKHKIPSLDFLRATCCHCYSKQLFLEMECHILKSLNWEIDAPTHDSFVDLVIKEQTGEHSTQPDTVKQLANFLCQLMQFHYKCTFNYTVSQIAIAAVLIANKSLTLAEEHVYMHVRASSSSLQRLVDLMLTILIDTVMPNSIKNKYNHEKMGSTGLMALYTYAHAHAEEARQYCPATPLYTYYNTPMASRQSSTSSSDSASDVFSRGSTSTLATPPSSCTASPVNFKEQRVPLQQLKIHAPPPMSRAASSTTSGTTWRAVSELMRKRSLDA